MNFMGFQQTPKDSNRFYKFATSHEYVESKGIQWIPLDSMDVHRFPDSYYYNVCGIHGIHRNPMDSMDYSSSQYGHQVMLGFHGIPWNSKVHLDSKRMCVEQ